MNSIISLEQQPNRSCFKKQFSSYLINSNVNLLLLNLVTGKEISEIISKIIACKAVGPNSIRNGILKEYKDIFKVPLPIVITIFFKLVDSQNNVKQLILHLSIKKSDKLDTSNCRSFSLLSNISKNIEKTMYSRLYKFLDKFSCLYKQQFGFRNSHLINHALASIIGEIRKVLDNDEFTCGVFLDFKKTFDTVNHETLIAKLNYYRISEIVLDWFKSYLTNRMQLTSTEKEFPQKQQ